MGPSWATFMMQYPLHGGYDTAEGVQFLPAISSISEGARNSSASEGAPNSSASEGASAIPTVTQDSEGEEYTMPNMINLETAGYRRSPRIASQPAKRYSFVSILSKFCAFGVLMATAIQEPSVAFSHAQTCVDAAVHQCTVMNTNFDSTINDLHHMALSAAKSGNECYTFHEMLKQDDASDFIEAMLKETKAHEDRGHWEVVKRSSMPAGMKTIQAIWSFKRKRFPSGLLDKYKARLSAHGGMQQW